MAAAFLLAPGHASPMHRRRDTVGRLPFCNSYLPNLLLLVAGTLILLAHIRCADAALRNITVDDEFGDELTGVKPTFLPTNLGIWEGEGCTGCFVKPDPALMHNATYNAATYRTDEGVASLEFSFEFTGTDVYVFLTLANSVGLDYITTLTETNFTIDDGPATFFRHEPNMSTQDFVYHFPAFVQHNLEHRNHTLRARTSGPDYHIYINFDYAVYTGDDELIPRAGGSTSVSTTTSSTSTTSTTSTTTGSGSPSSTTSPASSSSGGNIAGPVAGGVVGGLAIFTAFLFAFLFIRRQARRASASSLAHSDIRGVVGVAGAGSRGRQNRRREEREYPNPEIFASNRLHNTAGATTYSPITPFMYTSSGGTMASSHSLVAQTQGGTSSRDGSGGGITPYPTALYGAGRDGSGAGRGGSTFPQPVRKHRLGGSGGGSSGNTGLSYTTDVRAVGGESQLPAYTPDAQLRRKR